MKPAAVQPVRIYQVDAGTLGIDWSDGRHGEYGVRELRLGCTCASCVHEWTGEQLVKEEQVPRDVHPLSLETVGHYGLRIQWSDGHNTGIYTFDHLHSLGEKR